MNVLALNCGSSSVKFRLLAVDPGADVTQARALAGGIVDRLGPAADVRFEADGRSEHAEEAGDVRDLLAREADDPRARLALNVFCHRARKYLGAYLAALEGADAAVFTGAMGARSPDVRARILRGFEWCGLALDDARNRAARGSEATISPPASAIRVLVIPADEERVIARETAACWPRHRADRLQPPRAEGRALTGYGPFATMGRHGRGGSGAGAARRRAGDAAPARHRAGGGGGRPPAHRAAAPERRPGVAGGPSPQ